MNSKLKGWLFALVIIVILMIPIIVDSINKKKLEITTYDKFIDYVETGKFALIYVGNTTSEDFANTKTTLVKMKNDFEITVKAIDSEKLLNSEKESLSELNDSIGSEPAYLFVEDGTVAYIHSGAITNTKLETLINKYYNDIIPAEEIAYKVAKDYSTFKKAIDSKNIIMAVYGRDNCSWCNKFKPVFNEVADEYGLDIYYFSSTTYDKAEYSKIMNSGLVIPASCTDSKTEELLSSGFGTPLTLFTQKGKVIDCISGYKSKSALISKLKDVGMIK